MTKDYVVVTTVSSFRVRYVMHKDDLQALKPDEPCCPEEWAKDEVTMENCDDFSQEYMGEYILDTTFMNEEEMLELFDKDNAYLKEWDKDYKIEWVRKSINSKIKF